MIFLCVSGIFKNPSAGTNRHAVFLCGRCSRTKLYFCLTIPLWISNKCYNYNYTKIFYDHDFKFCVQTPTIFDAGVINCIPLLEDANLLSCYAQWGGCALVFCGLVVKALAGTYKKDPKKKDWRIDRDVRACVMLLVNSESQKSALLALALIQFHH